VGAAAATPTSEPFVNDDDDDDDEDDDDDGDKPLA